MHTSIDMTRFSKLDTEVSVHEAISSLINLALLKFDTQRNKLMFGPIMYTFIDMTRSSKLNNEENLDGN